MNYSRSGEHLRGWIVRIDQELHAAREKFDKELDRLLELLAARQRPGKSEARKSGPVLQQGETAEALAVLAAQLRLRSRTSIADEIQIEGTRLVFGSE